MAIYVCALDLPSCLQTTDILNELLGSCQTAVILFHTESRCIMRFLAIDNCRRQRPQDRVEGYSLGFKIHIAKAIGIAECFHMLGELAQE